MVTGDGGFERDDGGLVANPLSHFVHDSIKARTRRPASQ
jgi:hypothetical protein